MSKQRKIYPESGVELSPLVSRYYDTILNLASFGLYHKFIKSAIRDMGIQPDDDIIDLGCGTGRNACLMQPYISKKGSITGVDISDKMEKQFLATCKDFDNVHFIRDRADKPLDTGTLYDKVFISFVIHGFPHEVRKTLIENVQNMLKPGGQFIILDFAEFDMAAMPWHHRFVFKTIECPYAFDYIEKNWTEILSRYGFRLNNEYHYFKNYVRLLIVEKNG
ncbi:MAG TPA: class I SAM-dependent methyltransferase [Bacteroidales bacterium]|nr:class I SAM-dependent methyltransferase [Bacteroidales bacterium]